MESLPATIEAESPLSQRELDVLREQYESNIDGPNSYQFMFNYAWGLVRSRNKTDISNGMSLLREIYRANPNRRRECLYYIALAEYKLGNNTESRKHIKTLLDAEPDNIQAINLNNQLNDQVAKDGMVGLAIAGTAIAAVGILTSIIFKRH